MTFEEYKQALEDNTGFTAERGRDLDKDKIYIGDKNEWQSLVVLNLSHNCVQRIIGGVLKDYPPSDIAYLFDKTKEFLGTPNSKRGLEPVYKLVWQDGEVLGYNVKRHLWNIGKETNLQRNGYRTIFSDKTLAEIAGCDGDFLDKMNAIKEQV